MSGSPPTRILAIDVGSSSVKAAVVDMASAEIIGQVAHQPYVLDQPAPDAAEVPLDRLWEAIAAAGRSAADGIGATISGVGFSCMTPVLVLLGKDDRPLLPAWTHLDRRARPFARQLWKTRGAEFLQFAGNRPLPGGISAVCFGQIASEQPKKRAAVRSYLHLNGWLGFHLTGEKFFDSANASFTGVYPTIRGGDWSSEWCEVFGIDPEWLPPVVGGDHTVGGLRAEVAAQLGLKPAIPVKLGTADTTCSMLALAMKPEDLLHGIGTTQVLLQIVDRPQPAERRLVRRLGVGDGFVHVTHNPVGGAALEWLRQLCFSEVNKKHFYEQTVLEAGRRQSAVVLDPPFLGGDRLQIEACHAAFRELGLGTRREDLLTALIEAMRRGHDEAFEALGGAKTLKRVYLTGGGATAVKQLLPQYEKADVRLVDNGALRGVARLFT